MRENNVLVVGAAIIHADRVLAARRRDRVTDAGGWEFPGGKVEAAEAPDEALRREILEELGCEITVLGWLAGEEPVGTGHYRLRVARAELLGGEPLPHEHDALVWLSWRTLRSVDWLPADVPFLDQVARLLKEER